MLYIKTDPPYMRDRCPRGTSNNRKAAFVRLTIFGGPLRCTSIIALTG